VENFAGRKLLAGDSFRGSDGTLRIALVNVAIDDMDAGRVEGRAEGVDQAEQLPDCGRFMERLW